VSAQARLLALASAAVVAAVFGLALSGCSGGGADRDVPPPAADALPPPPFAAGGPGAQPAPFGPLNPDRRCSTDADCVVKDVGSCCGSAPACVARDAVVDRAAVQAACAAEGTASICGFPEITACTCVEGQCAAAPGPAIGPAAEAEAAAPAEPR